MTTTRVRFCPAPSGVLHVGSVRAALYNWLHARRRGGTFVFRIEDTDVARATEESMHAMVDALSWVGLDWDEGPDPDAPVTAEIGDHGPYRQSRRAELYAAVAHRLEEAGHLYRDFRTAEELEAWREQARRGQGAGPPVVKAAQFAHSDQEQASFAAEGRPWSLRLATPSEGTVVIDDVVRGEVRFDWAQISDPVLMRSDGSATYPLANSVDDVAQGITLICRGEDLLSVTPRQLLIHQLLEADGLLDAALAEVGFPARDPSWGPPAAFAHLPMVVGPDRKKLSKRHGSVAIQEFARQGFLPETMRNYLALLGWGHAEGRERLSDKELIDAFDLAAVGRSAAAFDLDKLAAFNGERIRELDPDDLTDRLIPFLDGTHDGEALLDTPAGDRDRATLRALVPLVQERMQRLDEIRRYATPFFRDRIDLDETSVRKVFGKSDAPRALEAARVALAEVDWDLDAIEAALRNLAADLDIGFGKLAQPIRVAVTGSSVSPPLFESLLLLDRALVLARLDAAIPIATAEATVRED